MLIDKSNVAEFADKLVNDFSIRDSMGNNKIHLDDCSIHMVFVIATELLKSHVTEACNLSVNVGVNGGTIYLYDGVDEMYCRSLMTWGKVE